MPILQVTVSENCPTYRNLDYELALITLTRWIPSNNNSCANLCTSSGSLPIVPVTIGSGILMVKGNFYTIRGKGNSTLTMIQSLMYQAGNQSNLTDVCTMKLIKNRGEGQFYRNTLSTVSKFSADTDIEAHAI